MKQNGVSDDALRLSLFPYSLTHHAIAWYDRLPRNSIHSFDDMMRKFLSKYFPPSMVTKLRNEITKFEQKPHESLFEAWERYKFSIDRCPNHNMLLVTQIDTFYNGLTLSHRDTINAAAGGTFMQKTPEECELKAITTLSGVSYDGPSVPIPPLFINPEENEREEETSTDPVYGDFTIKLKCQALADLGASINLMPLSVWKRLGLPELIPTRMTLELANRTVCTPAGIARDVFVLVGKFTFPTDFIIVDYIADARIPLILRRPFLRTAHALIDVHGEELILRDGNERLILNMKHNTSIFSDEPQEESINMIDIYDVSYKDNLEDLFANKKITNNPESGNPTPISDPIISSSSTLTSFEECDLIWEEFEAYLANDSFPPGSDDADFDLEGDLRLIEELLNNDPSSPLPLSHNPLSSSTTSSSPSLTPVETSDALLEEFVDELALLEPFPSGIGDDDFDPEGDILLLEKLLNDDPSSPLPPKELNFEKLKMIKSSIDDFPPLDVLEEKSVTFSNPLFDSNNDFTSSDDESLPDEDVSKDNVKIYSNPLFEFDDEYISSEVNPLFNEELEDIESNESCFSNLDDPDLSVTPLSDTNEDECFDPGGDIDEINAFLDMDISMDIEDGYYDLEGDIVYLESLLINDTIPNFPPEVFLDHDLRSLKDELDANDLKSMVKNFNPDISAYSFYSLEPVAYECPMEDCPDYEDSRARGFVVRSLDLQSLAYLYGIPISEI
ncbi:reverse transcriptase domain-containing protein [Tanacetum coccineum]